MVKCYKTKNLDSYYLEMWLITYQDWSGDKPEYKAVIIREKDIVHAYYTFNNTITSADYIVSIVSCYID